MTTKTKTDCKTRGLCHYDSLTRTKFFHGMLLTDEHLRAEQTYHRESLKRLNRYLWGSGIVCGLEVTKVNETKGLCVKVHPGMALDCGGNAIEVCKCITIDLGDLCKKAYPDGCAPEDAEKIAKYLVLRHAEIPADPEPVLTPADDCAPSEGTKCEASKYREGFCLEFRDECPNPTVCEGLLDIEQKALIPSVLTLRRKIGSIKEDLLALRPDCDTSPPCPKCDCHDCAVGLAKLEIDCANNTVEIICECRDYVWSPRLMRWLLCGLLEGLDKLPPEVTGLKDQFPAAHAMIARPLRGAWDAAVVLSEEQERTRREQPTNLEARVSALEKGAVSRARPKEPKDQ